MGRKRRFPAWSPATAPSACLQRLFPLPLALFAPQAQGTARRVGGLSRRRRARAAALATRSACRGRPRAARGGCPSLRFPLQHLSTPEPREPAPGPAPPQLTCCR